MADDAGRWRGLGDGAEALMDGGGRRRKQKEFGCREMGEIAGGEGRTMTDERRRYNGSDRISAEGTGPV